MVDVSRLRKTWVEIRELGDGSKIVLKCLDDDIPMSRAPRRQLDLAPEGQVSLLEGSPTDQHEQTGTGEWRSDGQTLELNLKDWEGSYEIKELSDNTLILQRR